MTICRLSEIISPAFRDSHRAVKTGRANELVEKGGRGSAKSSYISVEVPLEMLRRPECHAVVMRKVANTLRSSVYAQICWAIATLGLSSHRGLPSAKLFTDLDQLAEGDTFILRILDETLTYEVDQIRTVEPYELDDLGIEEGKDYCTLVTCTPYGINTHRLLVRGRRVDNQPEARTVRVTADAMQIEPVLVAPLVAVPMLFVLLVLLLVKTRRKK